MEFFNFQFVKEVEKHPELYNYTLLEYSKKDSIEKAWNEVAKQVNLSVGECKEKWRNLRSTFVKNLKPKRSGSGLTKRKPYYLMDAMQFAIPFIKVAGNLTGNLAETSQLRPSPTLTPDISEMDNPGEEHFLSEELICKPEVSATNQQPSPSSLPSCQPPPTPPVPSPALNPQPSSASQGDRMTPSPDPMGTRTRGPHGQPIRKRKFADFQSDAEKAFVDYFSAKTAKISSPPPPKDKRDKREEGIQNFLLSLIPDLMQMNDVQLRSYKRKALLLIDEVTGTSPETLSSRGLVP